MSHIELASEVGDDFVLAIRSQKEAGDEEF
jgi:hypothetical protein